MTIRSGRALDEKTAARQCGRRLSVDKEIDSSAVQD